MGYQRDRAEFLATLTEELAEYRRRWGGLPIDDRRYASGRGLNEEPISSVCKPAASAVRIGRRILTIAERLHTIAEKVCNVPMSEEEQAKVERRELRLETELAALCKRYGLAVVTAGDPRGPVVKLRLPLTKRADDWGGEGRRLGRGGVLLCPDPAPVGLNRLGGSGPLAHFFGGTMKNYELPDGSWDMDREEADHQMAELQAAGREADRARKISERHADDAMRSEALAEYFRRDGLTILADHHAEEAHAARWKAAEACPHNGGISLPKECGGGARCYDCGSHLNGFRWDVEEVRILEPLKWGREVRA
jgi:hypothetical protein